MRSLGSHPPKSESQGDGTGPEVEEGGVTGFFRDWSDIHR